MTDQGILGAFSSHAFMRGLSERHRMALAMGARPFQAAAGELLAHEGQPAAAFYLVQSGEVAIETHHPERGLVRVQTVGPGEIVGWSWIVPPYRWQFDARALEPTAGISLDAVWLRDQCSQDHELGYHLLKELVAVIASRLAATRLQLLDIYK